MQTQASVRCCIILYLPLHIAVIAAASNMSSFPEIKVTSKLIFKWPNSSKHLTKVNNFSPDPTKKVIIPDETRHGLKTKLQGTYLQSFTKEKAEWLHNSKISSRSTQSEFDEFTDFKFDTLPASPPFKVLKITSIPVNNSPHTFYILN